MADLLVYAVGDSVMWGEGLAEENKFAFRTAASLAKARALKPNLKLLAHCGASIKQDFKKREVFVNKFSHLFRNEKEKTDFLAASGLRPDERPAERLHGEIARAFPTVPHQIRSISESQGAEIDILLVNGGANDLDFEKVFLTEDFLKLDADYERIFHDDVTDLLALAREKCPKAVIVLIGYYSAFSPESRFLDVKDMFLVLSKFKEYYDLYCFFRPPGILGTLLEGLTGVEDKLEHIISVARAASESGESRGLYWMRKAVSDINEDPKLATIRGPGVVFASPGFLPKNCIFAPETFIWQRYEGEMDDDVATDRLQACPSAALRDRMAEMAFRLVPKKDLTITAKSIVDLHNALDGPIELRTKLSDLSKDMVNFTIREPVATLLTEEVARIDITRISSLFHPNRRGAARYASVIHKRAEEFRETSVRDRILAFLPPAQRNSLPPFIEVRKTIRRYELNSVNPKESIIFDTSLGLKACLAHAEPDVIGLVLKTHDTSDIFSREVFLNLGAAGLWKLRHLLMEDLTGDGELNPHLKPGSRDFFTIDVSGQMVIGDITQFTIQFDRKLTGEDEWKPLEVTLSIDGRDVFRRKFPVAVSVNDSMSLEYPRSDQEPE